MARDRVMQRLGAVLPRILDRGAFRGRSRLLRLADSWAVVVGEDLAARTRPRDIRSGVLEVLTHSPAWMNELVFVRDLMLEKVNAWLGPPPLSDIRFSLERVDRLQPEKGPGLTVKASGRLTAAEKACVEATAGRTDLPDELRKAATELVAGFLKKRKVLERRPAGSRRQEGRHRR